MSVAWELILKRKPRHSVKYLPVLLKTEIKFNNILNADKCCEEKVGSEWWGALFDGVVEEGFCIQQTLVKERSEVQGLLEKSKGGVQRPWDSNMLDMLEEYWDLLGDVSLPPFLLPFFSLHPSLPSLSPSCPFFYPPSLSFFLPFTKKFVLMFSLEREWLDVVLRLNPCAVESLLGHKSSSPPWCYR